MARGYSKNQISKISAPEFARIKEYNISPFEHETNPNPGRTSNIPNNLPIFQKVFAKWVGNRQAAKTTAMETGQKFTNIPLEDAPAVIKYLENPSSKAPASIKNYAVTLRNEFDTLRNDAVKQGMDIGYLRDYLTHIWKENPQTVAEKYQSASQKFKFGKQRVIPTYEEGQAMGLTPKYQHPAQILTEYTRRIEETKANLELFKDLKKEHIVVSPAVGGNNPGYAPLTGPGFPKQRVSFNGKTIIGDYYAPVEIAKNINSVFSDKSSNWSMPGQVSSKI